MPTRTRVLPMLLLPMLAAAAVARAQTSPFSDAPIHWHVMGGYSAAVGTSADFLQGGYIVGAGLSVTPSADMPFDLRFDLSYSDHEPTRTLLDVAPQQPYYGVNVWSASGNLVFRLPLTYGVRAYGIGGVGVYHTNLALGGDGPFGYCQPFDEFCGAENGATKFGWNAGAGLEFALPFRQSWFVEARYTRVDTAVTPLEYLPITVGYRF